MRLAGWHPGHRSAQPSEGQHPLHQALSQLPGSWNVTSYGPALLTGRVGVGFPTWHCHSSSHINHCSCTKIKSPGCLNGNEEEWCPFILEAMGPLDPGPSRCAPNPNPRQLVGTSPRPSHPLC